jgi:hypothetical protein
VLQQIHAATGGQLSHASPAMLHYLDGRIHVDMTVDAATGEAELDDATRALEALVRDHPHLQAVRLHREVIASSTG